jgi:protein NUD1
MNPVTLEFYLPLMIRNKNKQTRHNPVNTNKSDATAGSASPGKDGSAGISTEKSWMEQDRRFRQSLPDQTYVKRMAYRGILMRVCGHLQMLDGVMILGKERKKAEMLLQGLENE